MNFVKMIIMTITFMANKIQETIRRSHITSFRYMSVFCVLANNVLLTHDLCVCDCCSVRSVPSALIVSGASVAKATNVSTASF